MDKLNHWKLGVHLIFKTRRFGVNNMGWIKSDSMFGVGLVRFVLNLLLVYPVVRSYKSVRWRMGYSVGFVSEEEYGNFFKP